MFSNMTPLPWLSGVISSLASDGFKILTEVWGEAGPEARRPNPWKEVEVYTEGQSSQNVMSGNLKPCPHSLRWMEQNHRFVCAFKRSAALRLSRKSYITIELPNIKLPLNIELPNTRSLT